MEKREEPSLFGLKNSNRDFTVKDYWGKNQFNSSFPASLCCYIHSINEEVNYLSINNGFLGCFNLSVKSAFGIDPLDEDVYFAFESLHSPFQQYVIGSLPRTDLVIQKKGTGECLAGIEIKLTALPDNSTHKLDDLKYGSEIVVRPDTIVYLACSVAKGLGQKGITGAIDNSIYIQDWSDARQVLPFISKIIKSLRDVFLSLENKQSPFLLQPIWKTNGKSPELAENCLDVFFWSDSAFIHFITEITDKNPNATKINRQTRTAVWLFRMLLDISTNGKFNHHKIIDDLSYNTKNDKAFASSGKVTNKFMACKRLETPLIKKTEIKNIILGGGQELLSPERRFDAIIYNSSELFSI